MGVQTREETVFSNCTELRENVGENQSARLVKKLFLRTFYECLYARGWDNLTHSPQTSVRNSSCLQPWVGFELLC